MAINSTYTQNGNTGAADGARVKVGRLTLGADSITATDHLLQEVGFTPRYVKFTNLTDRISVEWFEGMADDTCLKTAAAGTQTLETTNKGVTICTSDGTASTSGRCFKVSQNATLAVIAASKVITWVAHG
jgi:hypothetical protein